LTLGCCFTPVSVWDGYYVSIDHVAQDTFPFGPALGVMNAPNQRWQVVLDDASDTASFISHSHLLDGIGDVWFIAFRRFIPLLPFDDQSPSRG